MNLTNRDLALLRDLGSYALHTTRTIRDRLFPGVAMTTVLRRLRVLEDGGYVQRIEGLPLAQVAWGVTKKAAEEILKEPAKTHFALHSLQHELKLTALRLRLEGVGLARSWRPEHEIRVRVARRYGLRHAADRTIPDGIMGVEIEGVMESVSIELELHPKNQARYREILRDYRTKKNIWGVWYVVGRATIGRQLESALRPTSYRSDKPFIFWSLLSDVMEDPLSVRLKGFDWERKAGQLWRPDQKLPAHTPALAVSTPGGENISEKQNSTAENDSEKIEAAS